MFEITGCDAVMVGRAAQGNPWFFRDAVAALKGEHKPKSPSLHDIAMTCSRHFDLLLENRGEKTGSNMMRKHFSNYRVMFKTGPVQNQVRVSKTGPVFL